ncbi:hypothetical protein [Cerasicoccus arenae]|uniref:hypothetical protein n=1 Tax=Cerasicoccus arenae TaxID=424488 RepID=UPI00167C0A4C|nr:hypothetical protein [Cerasicoccus arenae]MBK1860031.1 hypothetical protein [Cerasicoccus arenae]
MINEKSSNEAEQIYATIEAPDTLREFTEPDKQYTSELYPRLRNLDLPGKRKEIVAGIFFLAIFLIWPVLLLYYVYQLNPGILGGKYLFKIDSFLQVAAIVPLIAYVFFSFFVAASFAIASLKGVVIKFFSEYLDVTTKTGREIRRSLTRLKKDKGEYIWHPQGGSIIIPPERKEKSDDL